MKKLVVIALLAMGLCALAGAQSKEGGTDDILGTGFVQVRDGQGSIMVNSFGNTPVGVARTGFMIGTTGHVYEYTNFVSINNGAVEQTGALGWSVVTGLTVDGGTATSSVKRGEVLQIDFTHTVVDNGNGLVDWIVNAEFTNLTDQAMDVCYFPYLDYDLFNNENGDIATYTAVDEDFNVPTIRVHKKGRNEIFVFVDCTGSNDYRIGVWPSVRQLLQAGSNCIALGSTGSPFGPGDFTAAFKYSLAIAAGDTATAIVRMGRYQ